MASQQAQRFFGREVQVKYLQRDILGMCADNMYHPNFQGHFILGPPSAGKSALLTHCLQPLPFAFCVNFRIPGRNYRNARMHLVHQFKESVRVAKGAVGEAANGGRGGGGSRGRGKAKTRWITNIAGVAAPCLDLMGIPGGAVSGAMCQALYNTLSTWDDKSVPQMLRETDDSIVGQLYSFIKIAADAHQANNAVAPPVVFFDEINLLSPLNPNQIEENEEGLVNLRNSLQTMLIAASKEQNLAVVVQTSSDVTYSIVGEEWTKKDFGTAHCIGYMGESQTDAYLAHRGVDDAETRQLIGSTFGGHFNRLDRCVTKYIQGRRPAVESYINLSYAQTADDILGDLSKYKIDAKRFATDVASPLVEHGYIPFRSMAPDVRTDALNAKLAGCRLLSDPCLQEDIPDVARGMKCVVPFVPFHRYTLRKMMLEDGAFKH